MEKENTGNSPTFSYEASMERLESIIQDIEQKKISADQLISNLSEAKKIIFNCKEKLRAIENDVNDIL